MHCEHVAFGRLARPALRRRLEEGADAAMRENRRVEDRLLAELGVGRVQNQIAEGGPLFPEHGRTDRDTNGTQAGHKRRSSLKVLQFLAPCWP
jgi:hypothetical protein